MANDIEISVTRRSACNDVRFTTDSIIRRNKKSEAIVLMAVTNHGWNQRATNQPDKQR